MKTHRRLATIHVLAFSFEPAEPRRAEWRCVDSPGGLLWLMSEVVPFLPPDDPPPPAMAQSLAA